MATDREKEKFRDALAAAVDKYVKQQGRNTIAENAKSDIACKGYARVPGPDACDFCVTMGAANDFYSTANTAKYRSDGEKYHQYCNCSIVVVFGRDGRLVARDVETGEVVPYDGREFVERYNEIGRPTYDKKSGATYRSKRTTEYEKRERELDRQIKEAKSGLAKTDVYVWDRNMDELLSENGFRQDLIHIQHNANFSGSELMLAGRYADRGDDVEILHASSIPGSHTPDFRINGVPVEAKRLETDSIDRFWKKMWQASAQSRDIAIDLSLELVPYESAASKAAEFLETPMVRYLNKHEIKNGYSRGKPEIRVDSVTLVTPDGIATITR